MKTPERQCIRALHFMDNEEKTPRRWREGENGVLRIFRTIQDSAEGFFIGYSIVKTNGEVERITVEEDFTTEKVGKEAL